MKKLSYFHQKKSNWFKFSTLSSTKTNWDRPITQKEREQLKEIYLSDSYSHNNKPTQDKLDRDKLIRNKSTQDKFAQEKLDRDKLIRDTEDKIRQRNNKNELKTPTLFDDL